VHIEEILKGPERERTKERRETETPKNRKNRKGKYSETKRKNRRLAKAAPYAQSPHS
jgi:hypothetical protein